MKITPTLLRRICPVSAAVAESFAPALSAAMDEFEITNPARAAAFLAQVMHESAGLSRLSENLSYSADRLMKVWPKRFPTVEAAAPYARNPEKLANFVYANRMGNGGPETGDGYRYRGRGPIMVTGADNMREIGEALGLPLLDSPDLLCQPGSGSRASAYIWHRCGCNKPADIGDFDGVSDLINIGRKTAKEGDAVGYADRLALFRAAKAAFAVEATV